MGAPVLHVLPHYLSTIKFVLSKVNAAAAKESIKHMLKFVPRDNERRFLRDCERILDCKEPRAKKEEFRKAAKHMIASFQEQAAEGMKNCMIAKQRKLRDQADDKAAMAIIRARAPKCSYTIAKLKNLGN